MCPDIPVPVLNKKYKKENPGMASNVYKNIKALQVECDIITNSNWRSITKTRYVHDESNHTFFRADASYKINRINLKNISYDYDLIVISDYDKGFLLDFDIQTICNNHDNVFVDSKKILGDWISSARFIKINHTEYHRSQHKINEKIANKIIRTEGSKGCIFQDKVYPANKTEVRDVSGAGDSFLAALVAKYLENCDIIESIKFANICASEVVTKRGVSVIKCQKS